MSEKKEEQKSVLVMTEALGGTAVPEPEGQEEDSAETMTERTEEKLKKANRVAKWLGVILGMVALAVVAVAVVMVVIPDGGAKLTAGTAVETINETSVEYRGAYVVDGVEMTLSEGEYASSTDGEAVFLVVNGGSLTLDGNVRITKTGGDKFDGSGNDYSNYGLNAAIVVIGDKSSATIRNTQISTTAAGGNAVMAVKGGEITITGSTVETNRNYSRGLVATYGGKITADAVTIKTSGNVSPAVMIGNGSGTLNANDLELTTSGSSSPLLYSLGQMAVETSGGRAMGAQIAVLDGRNVITLSDCTFAANGVGENGANAGILVQQSAVAEESGDAAVFTATNSSLTVMGGSDSYAEVPMFLVRGTVADINLSNTVTDYSESAELVKKEAGARVELMVEEPNAETEELEGMR